MDNQQKMLIMIAIVVAILVYFLFIQGNSKTQQVENFENEDTRSDYEGANKSKYQDTLYERSAKSLFPQRMLCNLIPIMPVNKCLNADGKAPKKPSFPVHILPTYQDGYIAVFNDGKIYKKDELEYPFWTGPLDNSMPKGSIPLRMVALDPENLLLGVGYNNKLYKKVDTNILSEWVEIPKAENIIYVLFEQGNKPVQDKLIAINVDGMLMETPYNTLGTSFFEELGVDMPVLKMWHDKSGFLLGLGTDFRMYRKGTNDWRNSEFDVVTGANPSLLNDAVYDVDGKMYGLVIVPKLGIISMMKQKVEYYLSQFIPMEMQIKDNENKKKVMGKIAIVKAKSGVNFVSDRHATLEYGDLDIKQAQNKLKTEEYKRLRNYCGTRGTKSNVKYENYEFLNRLENQHKTIEELENVLTKLKSNDPSRTKLQDIQI